MMTDEMMMVIEGLQHRIARWIAGMTARKGNSGEWEWALVGAALETTWIWTIREYVKRKQATITDMYQLYQSKNFLQAQRRWRVPVCSSGDSTKNTPQNRWIGR